MAELRTNPYNYCSPIEEPSAFYGRQAQLAAAREHIQSKECISFVGEPRSGLTSLMNRLARDDFRQSCEAGAGPLRFVRADCARFGDPLSFVRYLISQVNPDYPLGNLKEWGRAFGRLIALLSSLDHTRVVVLFDDFECMGSDSQYVEFLDAFRAVVPRAEMTLITATHRELHKCCHEQVAVSPFPNIFTVQYLGAFTQEEAMAFLRSTSARSEVDLVPYASTLLGLSGGLPYFLQMACWHYFQGIAGGGVIDRNTLAASFCAEARPEFEFIWQRLGVSERRLLKALAQGAKPADATDLDLVWKGYVADGELTSTAFRDFVLAVD